MYEWDESKRQANLAKHGVDFADMDTFEWDTAALDVDEDHAEPRWIAIGFIGTVVHFVVFTERGDNIRIISLSIVRTLLTNRCRLLRLVSSTTSHRYLPKKDGTMDRASKILNGLALSKPQRCFLTTLFTTILITRGKINLRNLARYSAPSEKTYARQFAQPMDWVAFNRALINETLGSTGERVVAFDPRFLPKAGKHTFGRAAFWHGSHSRLEPGLEVSALAVIDVGRHQALTLSVRQTQPVAPADETTLIDQYVEHIRQVGPQLEATESYLCVDGGLARRKRLDGVCALGGHLIGKLRRDARLRYLYAGPPRPGRGRQQVYDGPVDWADHSRLEAVGHDGSFALYTAVLNHAHFQRNLRIVRLGPLPPAHAQAPILLFSTDTQLDPWTIYRYYQARFQIELLFRDAKQFTGLTEGQIRDKARLDFHFNASLTTLNLAKAQLLEGQPADQPASCSIATLKAHYFNEHYLNQFIAMFGLDPTWIKNHPHYQRLRDYGKIAA